MKKTSIIIFVAFLTISFGSNAFADGKDKNKAKNLTPTASATAMISGQVLDDETGEALTGVLVKINGADQEAYTDFDGNFTFRNVSPGEYCVVAKMISYQVHVDKNIKVDQGGKKKVKVKMKKNKDILIL